jgi:superfamily II DNA or RNA helicase
MELKDYVERNPAVLLSDRKVRSLLSDIYMNNQLSVNLMMNAYSIGIIAEMRETFPVEQFTITRWAKKLVTDFGISDEKARWAINTWVSAISRQVLTKLDAAEQLLMVDEEAERRKREEEARLLAEEERKRLEAEKQASEEIRRSTPDARLNTKGDYSDYYINPTLDETREYIYVPCGFGQSDNGFLIYGIKKQLLCTHKDANIFALVYNYLTRSSTISDRDIPQFLQKQEAVYELDYQTIFRLAIILLQLVHHNHTQNGAVVLNYSEDTENLRYALHLINHYAALFCRLIGIETVKLQVKTGNSGLPLSLHSKISGVYITDNKDIVSNARELWYGRKINYHLTKDNLPDLEYILHEISDFDSFKEGQFSALCDMLACRKHAVCIMPTGSGKSLIFYMASLLQPLPLFIVSPTDILIQDQIRNLKKFHRMDNVAHLQLTEENSFANWEVYNSLNYITPMTFQNRNLLVKFRYLNEGTRLIGMHEERVAPGALVSYVVLDEIHCLSNWGHDFRPEYLMLSKYLNKFFDHISFWGFTATANYTVVEDVQKQLDIPQDNFFSPIAFERFNVSYDFRTLHSEEEMLKEIASITASLLLRNERTIVFTKSDVISEKVADAIGWEADIFSKENPSAYYHFAAGDSKILVASDELGIGINLPNIRNIIHFGLPLSKNEFVQEIGRAGRANEKVKSYVLYLDTSPDNVPEGLLKRNTPIQSLPTLLEGYDNDYTHVYMKLSNGAISDNELYQQLIHTYQDFVERDRALVVDSFPLDTLTKAKQHLYMLYLTGYVNDWYSYSQSKDGTGIDILVDICSTDADSYKRDPNKMLNRMKERMYDYFAYMGNDRESIAKVERAKTPEAIIEVYVKWYYEKYLYHHNEQFLDLFEFISANVTCDRDKITEEIKDYFVLPFAKLKSDEALYNELSLNEIISKTIAGVSKNTLVNLERINSNRYSYKLDLALFCGQLRMNDVFDENRLDRVLSNLPNEEIVQLGTSLAFLYPSCNSSTKIDMLKYMEKKAASLGTTFMDFLKKAYSSGQKDEIYYGIMANKLNKVFDKMRRSSHV